MQLSSDQLLLFFWYSVDANRQQLRHRAMLFAARVDHVLPVLDRYADGGRRQVPTNIIGLLGQALSSPSIAWSRTEVP